MVDFQERDTRRGLDDLRADEEADEDDTDDEGAEDEGGHDHEHEHDHEHTQDDHHHAHDIETVGAAVLTISSTRSLDDDPAGDTIATALEAADHQVVTRDLIRDDFDSIQGTVDALVSRSDVDIVVTTGGTGVTPDDVTVEAVSQLFEKQLPGFGELFRQLSYDEIGTRVVGTRATAGIADGVPVFCLPGSENATRLGTEEIIAEEAGHLAGLAHPEEEEEE